MYFVACEDERKQVCKKHDEAVDSRSLVVILARESGNEDQRCWLVTSHGNSMLRNRLWQDSADAEQSEIFTRAHVHNTFK